MAGGQSGLRRGRILYSILGLLFAVGVVPLVWTSYRLYNTSRLSIESNQKEWQLDKARLISSQVSIYVDGVRTQVTAIARTLEADPGATTFAARLARMSQQRALDRLDVQHSTSLVYVSVVDTTGIGTYSGWDLRGDTRLQEQLGEAFQRGQRGTRMLSVPIVSESLQEPVVVIGEPVVVGPRVEGVVLAVGSLQPIRDITRQSGSAGLFEVYVVDNRGRLIAHSDPKRALAEDVSGIEIVRIFLEQSARAPAVRDAAGRPTRSGGFGTTLFEMKGADGVVHEMLGTYVPVPDESGWGVVVQVDIEKAYFTAIDLRNKSILLVAVVTALAVVLGSLLAGGISRPVQRLAEGARRLAGGDYASRVAVRSRNEVGVLADAFNQMGEEIQKAIEEIRRRAEENKELFMGSIRMLANAIDEKDPYTRGHSERVAYYSACVAKHLGMSPEEVERVHVSGIIHDVGKIGIEDKILRKAAALTDEEYEIMKQHPTKGEHILEAVPLLKEKAGDGLMHHENVDGSGYPRGLKGDEIPLFGRIVSVADAFDAMTTDRPYSKAMTFEAAVARLRFLAGKKFDVQCVDAFERAFLTGDVSPAKARRASVASRHFDLKDLIGDASPPVPARGGDATPLGVNEMKTPAAPFRIAVLLVALAASSFAQSPPQAETRFSTGVMHLREGRVDLALEEFKRAVKDDPKNPYFQKGLGLAYAQKASELQLAAARRNPNAGPVGEWKDAIACFRKALDLNPFYVDVRNDLAAALIGSGDREGGKKEFLAAYSDPTNPTPEISARNLGQAYLEERNYADAISWFRTSLNRNKKYSDPYLGIADALLALDRLAEAVAQLEAGVAEIPEDPALLLALGQAYFKAGRFGEARARLEEVVRKDPAGPAGRSAAEQLKALPK